MRRVLGTAAVVALLVGACGCGADAEVLGDGTGSATTPTADPTADPSGPTSGPTGTPGGPAESTVVLLDGSAAGGTSSETLSPVTTEAGLAAFTAQLTSDTFVAEVRRAVVSARAGLGGSGAVLAAVVAIGCETPERVTHAPGSDRVEAVAPKVGTDIQCLVPVTTVAVVADPAA